MINDVCDMMEMGTSTERTVGPYSYAMYSSCFSVHPIEVGPIHKYSPDVTSLLISRIFTTDLRATDPRHPGRGVGEVHAAKRRRGPTGSFATGELWNLLWKNSVQHAAVNRCKRCVTARVLQAVSMAVSQ